MADWQRTWAFKYIIADEEKSVAEKAIMMRDFLTKKMGPLTEDDIDTWALEDVIDQFDAIGTEEGEDKEEYFDTVLDELYDFCDRELIWCGLMPVPPTKGVDTSGMVH